MRPHGQTQLGFFPLPVPETKRLKNYLRYPEQFSALDPCVGDGAAFATLLEGSAAARYGIEIDTHRAAQARNAGILTLQADVIDVRCPAESLSLLYLNPPYDWEAGQTGNQRLERVFLEHTCRWLKPEGVLLLVIPQARLQPCARPLAEHFKDIRIRKLLSPECVQYQQVVVFATRRKRSERLRDAALLDLAHSLERAAQRECPPLTENPDAFYAIPTSGPVDFTHVGLPLDEVEDLLPQSAAYRQVRRALIHEQTNARGRPLTP